MPQTNRATILSEDAEILSHQAEAGKQYILRVKAPRIAERALPGSFVHLTVHPMRPLRRPISIMRVDVKNGTLEFLYKAVGEGTSILATRQVGEYLNLLGPIGRPFIPRDDKPRRILIGGGVGMPPMIFLSEHLRQSKIKPFVILGSEVPFPFQPSPSTIMIPGMPDGVIATMPLLENWGIPTRLTSLQGYAGCHEGYVTDLARAWLQELTDNQRLEVEIFSCGPHPMLEAVARLADEYGLPCQVSMEEYMACGVGGCAGCTIPIMTTEGPAMKRVCVDGPVFEASQVFTQL